MMSPMGLLLMVVVLLSRVTVFAQTSFNVIVTVGDNVILICSTSENIIDIKVVTVEWRREKSLVLVFRSGKQVPEIQDSHFEGRAKLVYSDLKAGNLSMVLKNVTPRDSGIYRCFFFRDQKKGSPLSTTNLKVVDLTLTCSSELKAIESSNVTLNCTVSPWKDLSEDRVRWILEWLYEDKKVVHYTSQKVDDPNHQDEQFKKRTSLNKTELKHGKIVLTISNVTVDDTGNYTCLMIYDTQTINGFVKLEVTERDKNQLGEQGTDTNGSNSTAGDHGLVVGLVVVFVGAVIILIVLWKKGFLRSCARWYRETPQNDPQPQEVEVPLQQLPQEQPNNDELNPERDE